MHIDELRQWRQSASDAHMYATAELVGDKVLALTHDADDAYWLAQVHYASGEYLRGAAVALSADSLQCRYIAALCYVKALELDKALELLASDPPPPVRAASTSSLKRSRSRGLLAALDEPELHGISVHALLLYVKGQVYTLQARFALARDSYVAALRRDARCFDALAQLVKHHALLPREEWALLRSLDFGPLDEFGKAVYALRLSKLQHAPELADAVSTLTESVGLAADASDLLCAQADAAHAAGAHARARELCERALRADAHCRAYPVYIATLYALGAKNELYRVASTLAAHETPLASYAIGTYYLATARVAEARHYFSEASLADPGFAPAWLAFARTFAEESEHEQAVTAYSTVARLFPGYYLPLLCIGMQHLQLLNLGLAEKYFLGARKMCADDPNVLNELGVCYYRQARLPQALATLEHAAGLTQRTGATEVRIAVQANLGFVLLRMRQPARALAQFERVALEAPLDHNVCAALGLCHMHLRDFDAAVARLAQALTLGEDPAVADLLKLAVSRTVQTFDAAAFAHKNARHIARAKSKLEVP